MRTFKVGPFLPIGEGGFILSTTSPKIPATYGYNREVTMLAESLGMDFVFSMIKYRGIGVDSEFWHHSLESFTLMAALAECTTRVHLIGSVNILTIPPPIAAKMAVTIDHISHGRFGINIVTTGFPTEIKQMNLWSGTHDGRYDQASEYVTCLRRLWSEERVDFKGEYYTLVDCEASPKPLAKPAPAIYCAGASPRGLRFTIEHGDYSFITAPTPDAIKAKTKDIHEKGRAAGRNVGAMACLVPIVESTEAAARARFEHYKKGRDNGGVKLMVSEFGISAATEAEKLFDSMMFLGTPLIGDADKVAAILADMYKAGLDGAVFMFPDYIDDQIVMGTQVMPRFRELVERS